ncbi:MAG: hypothetical protein QF819_07565 [Gemmatimonadota bacterium]|jgi:uncharacterized protein YbjT (DUF2867 family)|nr:hypothetical protein [Gemmatimonadota bacterium]MDP6528475.1 hypothetical protein [Gemmatimonadota bacterium]MDP6803016.1 hypothetical protein [Gemmatimonadota bacterium]MDP7032279.1 hypothetical protein [Gemmatimonadota bacterium]
MRILIAGGCAGIRTAVRAEAEAAGCETGDFTRDAAASLHARDAVVDLGLSPQERLPGEALIPAESERAEDVAGGVPEGVRLVRRSLVGAAPDAPDPWRRAAHAAERPALERGGIILRAGLLMGSCAESEALVRVVKRSRLVPLPGLARARIEPLAVDDFVQFVLLAATGPALPGHEYDLGCGEFLTGELLVRDLAAALGIRRAGVALPGLLRGPLARAWAQPGFPRASADHLLRALAGGLLPVRMAAWKDFDHKPRDLRECLAAAAGMTLPPRSGPRGGRFGSWEAPKARGLLGKKLRGPKRRGRG